MIKKSIILILFIFLGLSAYCSPYPGFHWGISLGFFFNTQGLEDEDSSVESQVDSVTLFMINMKLGGLLRVGYHFNPFLATGLESGVLFNTYQQHAPLRAYFRFGPSDINLKLLAGVTVNREIPYDRNGLDGEIVAGTFEVGGRVEFINIYIEWLESNSLNDLIDDSTRISIGYSLFLPDL